SPASPAEERSLCRLLQVALLRHRRVTGRRGVAGRLVGCDTLGLGGLGVVGTRRDTVDRDLRPRGVGRRGRGVGRAGLGRTDLRRLLVRRLRVGRRGAGRLLRRGGGRRRLVAVLFPRDRGLRVVAGDRDPVLLREPYAPQRRRAGRAVAERLVPGLGI